MKTLAILLGCMVFSNFLLAQDMPEIPRPKGLDQGRFEEGTITKLNAEDVKDFRYWANSAQRVLKNALEDIQMMDRSAKVNHLETQIMNVVERSDKKNYQAFMRYALNRGLFFSSLIEEEASDQLYGNDENRLDILRGAIKVALNFYESDLAFQKRIEGGGSALKLEQAKFGIAFAKELYARGRSIQDATAQYRVLYKVLETLSWDLSQDRDRIEYASSIMEIFDTQELMDEGAAVGSTNLLDNIRKLNLTYRRAIQYLP